MLVRADLIPERDVPPEDYREARKLVRRREALVEDCTSAKNRIRAALADRGVTYDGDFWGHDPETTAMTCWT